MYSHKLIRWVSKIGHMQRDKHIAKRKREGMMRDIIASGTKFQLVL